MNTSTNQRAVEQPIPLSRLLDMVHQANASDIHLKSGSVPMCRVQGELRAIQHPVVDGKQLEALCSHLAGVPVDQLKQHRHLEFACDWSDEGRFRGHYYRQRGMPALALRVIPRHVPELQELRLPAIVKQLCATRRGLILITGATGSGKSTTLAALLNVIARSSCRHIVTIEDPVEYIIDDGRSCVSQRQVGLDVENFSDGLVSALRQDPDVLMIGEVRDQETMSVAMHAAITGHLVLAGVHFTDAVSTINGIAGMAPPAERASWRFRLAEALVATVSQVLLPRRDNAARILASEVLINEPSIKAAILDESKMRSARSTIARGRNQHGGHTLDQALFELVESRLITVQTAQTVAHSPAELMREINLRGVRV